MAWRLGFGALTVLAGMYAVGALPVPDLSGWISDLSGSLGVRTYVVVPLLAFLETAAFVGLVAPGETAVVVGGVVAERGEVSLVAMVLLVWAAAFAGDTASFLLGRRVGPAFLQRYAPRFGVTSAQLHRVDALFARHGGRAVFLGRFVGMVRPFVPFVAGTSGLALRNMLPYSLASAGLWSVAYTLAGSVLSDSFETAGETITRAALAVAVLVVVVAAVRRLGHRTTA